MFGSVPGKDPEIKSKPELFVPLFDILCPYLPAKWRHQLHCGVEESVTDDVTREQLETLDTSQNKDKENEYFANGETLECKSKLVNGDSPGGDSKV